MSILGKSRQSVTDCRVELNAERAEGVPSPFTKIHMRFVVTGRALKEAQVKRAVELSATKYCSASIMLEAAGVAITHDYVIEDAERSEERRVGKEWRSGRASCNEEENGTHARGG